MIRQSGWMDGWMDGCIWVGKDNMGGWLVGRWYHSFGVCFRFGFALACIPEQRTRRLFGSSIISIAAAGTWNGIH